MKPSTTPQIELLKERLRSNRYLNVTASVPSASLYTKVLPVKSAVVYSKLLRYLHLHLLLAYQPINN